MIAAATSRCVVCFRENEGTLDDGLDVVLQALRVVVRVRV
jgi:hypothetical protein